MLRVLVVVTGAVGLLDAGILAVVAYVAQQQVIPVTPPGGFEMRLAAGEWVNIILAVAAHTSLVLIAFWRFSLKLERRLTALETGQTGVTRDVDEIKQDVRAIRGRK